MGVITQQHQRVCMQIYTQICFCVLREIGLRSWLRGGGVPSSMTSMTITTSTTDGIAIQNGRSTFSRASQNLRHLMKSYVETESHVSTCSHEIRVTLSPDQNRTSLYMTPCCSANSWSTSSTQGKPARTRTSELNLSVPPDTYHGVQVTGVGESPGFGGS